MAQTREHIGRSGSADSDDRSPVYRYNAALASEIEARWQQRWDEQGVYHAPNPVGELAEGFERASNKPKLFVLDMFPYPSGVGLHVGHPLGYIATDIYARYQRMAGRTVLHAMGYDAFGLPAEQYAVQTGQHPRITTERNIKTMRRQLKRLGLGHDERRSVATTDVSFYKWTQWIFLQIFNSWWDESQEKARPIAELIDAFESGVRGAAHAEHNPQGQPWSSLEALTQRKIIDAHRLAYISEQPVNWCPALGTVLANEEVTAEGRSERGDHPVFKRPLKQWMLRITVYAQRLLGDLDVLDWPEPIKLMQRNWLGRSEGANIRFTVEGSDEVVEVFTTRPDTVFGATFMALAPEHPLVDAITPSSWPDDTPEHWKGEDASADSPREAVAAYRARAASLSDVQRQEGAREKTGVFTGACAVNPASGACMPIFIADYVLMAYGSGAIMAVPAHDDRDFEFAESFDLPIVDVVYPRTVHAIRWFTERAGDPESFPEGWKTALADFLGLIVRQSLAPEAYDDALRVVRTRRCAIEEPPPSGVERRGAVRDVWIETLAGLAVRGIAGLREEFMAGAHWKNRGEAFTEAGVAVNSPPIEGAPTRDAKRAITDWLEERSVGDAAVVYKLRDWLFSRQRYWGEPFPIVYDERDMPVALPKSMLPLELPEMDNFAPETRSGSDADVPEPPLARAKAWAAVELDLGEGPKRYRRELNTMPQWAGSCWYYLRYVDPANDRAFCDPANERYWMAGGQNQVGGVDLYVGGAEHAVLHLLYARFWHKVLFDLGYVSTPEPFQKLFNQGYIQAHAYRDERGVYVEAAEVVENPPGSGRYVHEGKPVTREYGKMGKSLKNALTPDEICRDFGADTLRLYEMAMGPLEQSKPWNTRDIVGVHRFLQRVWRNIVDEETGQLSVVETLLDSDTRRAMHATIAGVREDMESLRFNTAIAKLIEFNNALTGLDQCPREAAETLTLLLAPFAPHIAEELWSRLGAEESIVLAPMPEADESLLKQSHIEVPVQVMGKVRARITAPADIDEEALKRAALDDERVQQRLAGKQVRKIIVAPGRKLVNIVVE